MWSVGNAECRKWRVWKINRKIKKLLILPSYAGYDPGYDQVE